MVSSRPSSRSAKGAVSAQEARSADTRERILDAAEQLFTIHGYDGTSMRQITGDAQVNLAAVSYHFGSKETLMREVFRRRLDGLNEERMRALDAMEAEAAGRPLKPSQIVDAFFGTLLRLADDEDRGGRTFVRLLGRTMTDPAEFIRSFLAHEYASVIERFKAALFRSLPDVPRAEIVWRFHFMLGATSYAMAGTDALRVITDWGLSEQEEALDCPEQLLPRLMSFLLGGLRAPLPPDGPPAPGAPVDTP